MTFADLWTYLYDEVNSIEVTTVSSLYKLFISLILGSVVGFERKRKGQTAGIRTFALISMGATLAMILSIYVPQEYMGLKNGDPGRIAAQVITGIGFLGAGAIIQMKGSVRGLTTAAGIWMVAAIGMAVGVGMYWIAFFATLLILFNLLWLERFEHKINLGSDARIIGLRLGEIVEDIEPYREVLKKHDVILQNYYVDYDYDNSTTVLNLVVLLPESVDNIRLFQQLRGLFETRAIKLSTQISF
ncbi:MAG: MgtC/SapB family protein [Muribaculaceae bacterium]|nr:MgtC/SapB family protein [Muribaculaceae bacterium]